ncbi:MAG TPA: SLC13 family permease, partial [Gemmobacter sp.]|nr:SLC13 family permease [Gemmobacter sp.]
MFGVDLAQETQAFLAVAILAGMLVLFVKEIFPVEVTALAGAALMLVLGILPGAEVGKVLSNSAPWTIAAMFILVGALVRTGALDWVTQAALRHIETRPVVTLGVMALVILTMSAFVNNTPIVVVFIPVMMQLAKQLSVSPSKLLIPLSYLTIFGGTITLIGTSTNLLVDGVAREKGMAHFGIFEISGLGVVAALIGLGYLALFGRYLLPDRDSMSALLNDRSKMKFFTEVAVPEGSALIGRNVEDVEIFKTDRIRVIDVLRGDISLRRNLSEGTLEAG